ncbi:MAG: hypothetical protein ACOCQA_00430 [bacterium]
MNLIQELYRDSKDYVTEEDLIEAFREGASMYVRDQESLENKIYAAKNLRIPKYISAEVMEEDIFNMDHEFMQDLLSLERSPENLVDEYKDVIQAALDEM